MILMMVMRSAVPFHTHKSCKNCPWRLTHIRRLRSGWQDGDISRTISRLKRLERSVTASDSSPRAIVADFLSVVPLEAAGVTLEHCLELMPLLETLWKVCTKSRYRREIILALEGISTPKWCRMRTHHTSRQASRQRTYLPF